MNNQYIIMRLNRTTSKLVQADLQRFMSLEDAKAALQEKCKLDPNVTYYIVQYIHSGETKTDYIYSEQSLVNSECTTEMVLKAMLEAINPKGQIAIDIVITYLCAAHNFTREECLEAIEKAEVVDKRLIKLPSGYLIFRPPSQEILYSVDTARYFFGEITSSLEEGYHIYKDKHSSDFNWHPVFNQFSTLIGYKKLKV